MNKYYKIFFLSCIWFFGTQVIRKIATDIGFSQIIFIIITVIITIIISIFILLLSREKPKDSQENTNENQLEDDFRNQY